MARTIILGQISEQLLRDLVWTLRYIRALADKPMARDQAKIDAIEERIAELRKYCITEKEL